MKISELIAIASENYPDDLLQQSYDEDCGDVGDTLAQFCAREISETADANADSATQLIQAIKQMMTARDEIDGIINSLQSALEAD